MADLTVQTSSRGADLLTWSNATATTGDKWINTGKEVLLVHNGSGAPITVAITTPVTVDGLAVADLTVTVGAGKVAPLGPFPAATYSDKTDSKKAKVVCSSVTSVQLAVIKKGAL